MTELTDESFLPFVKSHRFAVIHFWAAWNRYDTQMKDLLTREFPADLREWIAFGSVDVDVPEHLEMCRQHPIRNIPFLAFYRDGLLVETSTGLVTPERLSAMCANLRTVPDR